jgi:hypothetical protein
MSELARQQQALLDALFEWPPYGAMKIIAACAIDPGARGLKAYQTNGHLLAERALQSAYPVVAQMLGEDSFGDLARAVWHAHPPTRGDLAQWGDVLPAFLRASVQLQDEPCLADVASTEWALHLCASAENRLADLSSLALLTTQAPEQVAMEMAVGCAVVRSPWPVASIMSAHLEQTPSLEEVGTQLRMRLAQDAVVWRAGLRPRVRAGLAGEADLLQALLQGQSLADALDGAPALDFGLWLPIAVQSGLLLKVMDITT